MSDTTLKTFFGDGEHDFCLTPEMIVELERLTGHGIGGIFKRMALREFSQAEMVQTIRLALIGGGAAPETAFYLTQTYAAQRPVVEGMILATRILNALFEGVPKPPEEPTVVPDTEGEAA